MKCEIILQDELGRQDLGNFLQCNVCTDCNLQLSKMNGLHWTITICTWATVWKFWGQFIKYFTPCPMQKQMSRSVNLQGSRAWLVCVSLQIEHNRARCSCENIFHRILPSCLHQLHSMVAYDDEKSSNYAPAATKNKKLQVSNIHHQTIINMRVVSWIS